MKRVPFELAVELSQTKSKQLCLDYAYAVLHVRAASCELRIASYGLQVDVASAASARLKHTQRCHKSANVNGLFQK